MNMVLGNKQNTSFIFFFLILIQIILLTDRVLPQDYLFHQLKIENGLSQSTVLSSLQDQQGYMWFATRNGLNRYDGYKFVVFLNNPKDSTSISDDAINTLFEDKNGTLWIGTINGNINRYNSLTESFTYKNIISFSDSIPEQTDEFYDYPLSFSRNQNISITSITEDRNGYLWIGTWGDGIFQIDKNFKLINHFYANLDNKNSLKTNRIMDLLFDDSGQLWIATFGGGLSRLSFISENLNIKYKFDDFPVKNAPYLLNDSKLIKLFQDSDKNLWIGSYYDGVSFIDKNQLKNTPQQTIVKKLSIKNSLETSSANTIMAIIEDHNNYLWFGTFGNGLIRYNRNENEQLHFYSDPLNPNSLGDNVVLSLSIDSSGIIWAGSLLGAGITKIQINNAMFHCVRHITGNENSLDDNVVWSIYQDSEDNLWIGTYRGGLNKYDPRTKKFSFIKKSTHPNSISSNHIRSIKEDKFGNLWIGTYDGGLNLLNKKTNEIEIFKYDPFDSQSIGGNQVQDIYIESDSVYWIAVFGGGLNKVIVKGNPFHLKLKFIRYKNDKENPNSISDNRVYSIFKSRDGTFWIGTFGGGLNSFNPKTGKFIRHSITPGRNKNIDIKNLMVVTEDSDGTIWLGSYGGGLTSFNRKNKIFTRYSIKEGLTSSVVYGILEDENKNLWISSDNGLFKLNLKTKEIKRFNMQDGLQSLEFNGGAYFKNNKNEMFFGGINGYNYFYPQTIKSRTYAPPIVISSIKIFNELYKGDPSEIILDHKKNFISFEFASLDYSDPKDNLYSYILEGLQDKWQFTDASSRIATYTNLSPGAYVFKVRGTNSDGVWNENYALVKIIILSPFWQKWWFIILAVIVVAFFIYYISTIRIKNLLAIEKLKSKLAADLHDNIGSGLTEISILSEVASRNILNDKSGSAKELDEISNLSRQLVDNMSDIVWVVNPKRDSLFDLIIRLKDSYSEILNSLGVSFKTQNIDKIENVKLPMEFKQNLYLIFKEAINNSIKHSKCTRIVLDAHFRNDVLEISLNDNGKGFDKNNTEYGNGIRNIENRAAQIGGKIKVKSSADSGTTISFIGRFGRISKLKSYFQK